MAQRVGTFVLMSMRFMQALGGRKHELGAVLDAVPLPPNWHPQQGPDQQKIQPGGQSGTRKAHFESVLLQAISGRASYRNSCPRPNPCKRFAIPWCIAQASYPIPGIWLPPRAPRPWRGGARCLLAFLCCRVGLRPPKKSSGQREKRLFCSWISFRKWADHRCSNSVQVGYQLTLTADIVTHAPNAQTSS